MQTPVHWFSDGGLRSNGVTGVLQRECLQETSLGVQEKRPVQKWRKFGKCLRDAVRGGGGGAKEEFQFGVIDGLVFAVSEDDLW